MAATKSTSINWKLYGGIAVVGVIVYFVMGSDSPTPTAQKPPPAARGVKQAGQSILVKEDYDAHFQPVMFTVADKFVPLVFKGPSDSLLKGGVSPTELTIPTNFTGGEPNWAFTGVVEVDGKKSALVENGTNGGSIYLKPGQKWKTSTVKQITEQDKFGAPESVLILRDVSGVEKPIQMQADVQAQMAKFTADQNELKPGAPGPVRNAPNAPLNPTMFGAIGGDVTIQNDASTTVIPVPGANGGGAGGQGWPGRTRNGGGGGGRGGRGGRGRGGGGNGGGG